MGAVLTDLEAVGAFDPLKPWAPAVFAADIVTDTYDNPQAVSAAGTDVRSLPLPEQHYSQDASQPFPLYGWIRVGWTGTLAVGWRPDWAALPVGMATDTAVAATAYGGRLFVFTKGVDDHLYTTVLDEAAPISWSGQHEVGGGTTDVARAAAIGADDKVYLFAKGMNDRGIYLNILDVAADDTAPGGTRENWTGWAAVPGGGPTDAGLTSTVGIDGRLYLFAKGIDAYLNTVDTSSAWSGWREVPGGGTTDAALRVCSHGARLVLFGKGIDDHKIYVNVMEPAGDWSGWMGVPGDVTTITSITPAEGPDGLLYAFAVTSQQQVLYTTNTIWPESAR